MYIYIYIYVYVYICIDEYSLIYYKLIGNNKNYTLFFCYIK